MAFGLNYDTLQTIDSNNLIYTLIVNEPVNNSNIPGGIFLNKLLFKTPRYAYSIPLVETDQFYQMFDARWNQYINTVLSKFNIETQFQINVLAALSGNTILDKLEKGSSTNTNSMNNATGHMDTDSLDANFNNVSMTMPTTSNLGTVDNIQSYSASQSNTLMSNASSSNFNTTRNNNIYLEFVDRKNFLIDIKYDFFDDLFIRFSANYPLLKGVGYEY